MNLLRSYSYRRHLTPLTCTPETPAWALIRARYRRRLALRRAAKWAVVVWIVAVVVGFAPWQGYFL